jgi:hypothetical protein
MRVFTPRWMQVLMDLPQLPLFFAKNLFFLRNPRKLVLEKKRRRKGGEGKGRGRGYDTIQYDTIQ